MCAPRSSAPPTRALLAHGPDDPAPLSVGQLRALAGAIFRGLTWGLPAVDSELRRWRTIAAAIPDGELRGHALSALEHKRGHAAGAALFAILPRRRDRNLLRLLVAYETIWDFLDTVHEHAPGERNGRQLHLALFDALNPAGSCADYYRYRRFDDGGYLTEMVRCCRDCCRRLPGYRLVRATLLGEAKRAQVLALNHERDPARRDALLREWAHNHAPRGTGLAWWELSGAASASLTVHALLAVAADPHRCSTTQIAQLRDAYNPWISAATTMLDSYVDQLDDAASGDHSYISHYPTPQLAIAHVRRLIHGSIERAAALPDGSKHTLLVAAMAAMYLAKDSATDPRLAAHTRSLARAGGSLTILLLPLLRAWRVGYRQSGA